MAVDGSVIIDVDLDTKATDKELAKLKTKIASLEKKISESESKRNPLAEKTAEYGAQLDSAKAKLQSLLAEQEKVNKGLAVGSSPEAFTEAFARKDSLAKELKAQQAEVDALQGKFDRVAGRLEDIDRKIADAKNNLSGMKEQAGGLEEAIAATSPETGALRNAFDKAEKSAARFGVRLRRLFSGALVFSVITAGLRSVRDWFGKVIKTSPEAAAAVARLRGALLTLAQPLVDVVLPAFTAFVNILARVINGIAQLTAMLFGKSAKGAQEAAEALHNETEALEGVGGAADEAGKSFAAFDEINQLSAPDSGGGGGEAQKIEPSFDMESTMTETQLDNLLRVIEAIGAALLAWKLAPNFSSGLKMALGLFLAIDGAVRGVRSGFDALNNGVNMDNIRGMLLGLLELCGGLALAFGPVAAGVGAVVGGLAMLGIAFNDAMKSGWTLENELLAIMGILSTGLGIGLITGSFIPALIGAIAALLVSLTIHTGHGEELLQGVRTALEGFRDFFVGIFTGDLDQAVGGLGKIFDGLKIIILSVLSGVKDGFLSFLDWLDEKTNGRFHGIITAMKDLVSTQFENIKKTVAEVIDSVKLVFTGLLNFITGVFTTDWELALDGVKDVFRGLWNGVISLLESGINAIVRGLNWMLDQINEINVDIPDWVPGVGGKNIGFSIPHIQEASIPRLAQGAVIPPNREFMAVLGDQKSGTNIETPLSTMVEAFTAALNARDSADREITLRLVSDSGFVRALKVELDRQDQLRGVKLVRGRG